MRRPAHTELKIRDILGRAAEETLQPYPIMIFQNYEAMILVR